MWQKVAWEGNVFVLFVLGFGFCSAQYYLHLGLLVVLLSLLYAVYIFALKMKQFNKDIVEKNMVASKP